MGRKQMFEKGDQARVTKDHPCSANLRKGELVTVIDGREPSRIMVRGEGEYGEWAVRGDQLKKINKKLRKGGE